MAEGTEEIRTTTTLTWEEEGATAQRGMAMAGWAAEEGGIPGE